MEEDGMGDIKLLDEAGARARIGELADVLADCVTGGASVGFMAPYGPADAVPFWDGVAASVGEGATLLFAAERGGRSEAAVALARHQ